MINQFNKESILNSTIPIWFNMQGIKEIRKEIYDTTIYRGSSNHPLYEINPPSLNKSTKVCCNLPLWWCKFTEFIKWMINQFNKESILNSTIPMWFNMQGIKEIRKEIYDTTIYRGSSNHPCYEINPPSLNKSTKVCCNLPLWWCKFTEFITWMINQFNKESILNSTIPIWFNMQGIKEIRKERDMTPRFIEVHPIILAMRSILPRWINPPKFVVIFHYDDANLQSLLQWFLELLIPLDLKLSTQSKTLIWPIFKLFWNWNSKVLKSPSLQTSHEHSSSKFFQCLESSFNLPQPWSYEKFCHNSHSRIKNQPFTFNLVEWRLLSLKLVESRFKSFYAKEIISKIMIGHKNY